jgi:predicted enzyme related to lactoylglutathione lyase
MGNPFVHVALMSTDVRKAKAFYGKLFDWKLEDVAMPGEDSMWVAYVNVGDLKAARRPRCLVQPCAACCRLPGVRRS